MTGVIRCMLACACICVLGDESGEALAAPPGTAVEAQPQAGSQPPRLLQQVSLSYPEEAHATGEHGDVSVLVDVDDQGAVVAVRFESGPAVFQDVSLEAASRLAFSPTTTNGVPVAATTRVWFHFAPPQPGATDAGIEILVTSPDPDVADTRARTTLDEEVLEKAAGEGLAETVSQVPGVRMAQGTADASKPIIRGQQERRLLVLYDGVRHESQKWGPDHATEIDPFSAGSISVIRGAAGARYGPDAMGGVILVEPPPMRSEPGVAGKALTSYASNGQRPYLALRVDGASEAGLSARVEGNVAAGASLTAPDYILGNTASSAWNLGGAIDHRWDVGHVRASWHHHDYRAGVFYGVNNSTPDDFQAQLEADQPVTADLWSVTYAIDRPYQEVSHDVGILSADFFGDWGSIEATYAFQINLRREYEQVREDITGPQFDFTLRTHSLDLLFQHPNRAVGAGDLEGGVGLQGTFQENVYRGLSLIPNFRGFASGVFAYERLSLDRVELEAGVRGDGLHRAAYLRDNDFDAHVRRDTLDEASCGALDSTWRCPADYTAGSFSVGTLVHVVPETLDLKLDLSSASRFPNVDELYLLGSAPTFPVFANGRPDLGNETARGASFTAGLRLVAIEVEASVYEQLVEDYVYFSPELNGDGEPRLDVTIRGTWPSWGYQPIDALFYGADGSVSIAPHAPVGLVARGGVVRAEESASGDHLIGTPGDHLVLLLVGRLPPLGPVREMTLRTTTELVATQSRVEPTADYAPPPDGYALLGAGFDAEIGRGRPVRVGFEGRNLLNTAYREYNSLLRYFADQPGRDLRVRVGMDF